MGSSRRCGGVWVWYDGERCDLVVVVVVDEARIHPFVVVGEAGSTPYLLEQTDPIG